MDIARIEKVIASAKGRQIVVASKYIGAEEIQALTTLGFHDFGENRALPVLVRPFFAHSIRNASKTDMKTSN